MAKTQVITPDSKHAAVERLYGFTISDDSSAAAVVNLREGSASGTIVMPLNIPADGTAAMMFGKATYLEFPGGCYVEEVSGSIEGALYY